MIETKMVPGTNIVEMTIEGKVSTMEFDETLRVFEEAIKQHGSIKVLERVGELGTPPIPWSRFWEDIKFGFEHLRDISVVAVVSDQRWISGWVKMFKPLLKADIRMFKEAELEKARQWLGQ